MKSLNGSELSGFIKERQAHQVRSLKAQGIQPRLLILRDSDNPVIAKYVNLKIKYGEDIGISVDCLKASSQDALREEIIHANVEPSIHGIIIQLPLTDKTSTEALCDLIAPAKDVDGLGKDAEYDSATATAISWLLAGYDIKLDNAKIALVGRGKLVGAPLYKILTNSGYLVDLFHRGSDLSMLRDYDIIITATGIPGLITSDMVSPGTTIIDAGTTSESGHLVGDVAPEVHSRTDLAAITPAIGGVGPLTISCLFDHVIQASQSQNPSS